MNTVVPVGQDERGRVESEMLAASHVNLRAIQSTVTSTDQLSLGADK